MQIFKHQILTLAETQIRIPIMSEIIKAAFQGDLLYIWVLSNEDHPGEQVIRVQVFPTGRFNTSEDLFFDWEHIDTIQKDEIVYHVFTTVKLIEGYVDCIGENN